MLFRSARPRRTAGLLPAATGQGRGRERVWELLRVVLSEKEERGGPGVVGFVGNARRLWATVDGVHAIDGLPVRRGHELFLAMQRLFLATNGTAVTSGARLT